MSFFIYLSLIVSSVESAHVVLWRLTYGFPGTSNNLRAAVNWRFLLVPIMIVLANWDKRERFSPISADFGKLRQTWTLPVSADFGKLRLLWQPYLDSSHVKFSDNNNKNYRFFCTLIFRCFNCRSLFNAAAYLAALRRLRSPFQSVTPTRNWAQSVWQRLTKIMREKKHSLFVADFGCN